MDPKQVQYAEKITLEEYNRQKDEYTQNALKELQQQMHQIPDKKKFKILNKTNLLNSNNNDVNSVIDYSDDYLIDYSDNDTNEENEDKHYERQTNVNLIIQNASAKEKSKSSTNKLDSKKNSKQTHDRNVSNASIINTIYAQHELDVKTIQSLKDLINKLKNEIEEESRKNYYLRLDLNNSQCDNSDLKKENTFLKNDNEHKIKQITELRKNIMNNEFYMMIMKFTIIVLFLISILY